MDSQLEKGQGVAQGTLGGVEGGTARRGWARGRRAAPAPDGGDLPAKLKALVRQRFPYLNGLLNALPDLRSPDDCLYTAATVLWMVVLGFLCRKGARNAMDADRNTGMAPANLLSLSGQRRWPAGRPVTAPCTQTATRFLDILAPGRLGEVLVAVTRALLRGKLLDSARLDGWVLVAVDGTKQENYRRLSAPWRRKYRYVLHAKVIGPDGTAFTVMAEPCDAYDTERGKLDSERAAFRRLAPRLKAAFPKLPICLLGDALFTCEPVFSLCERFGWRFVLTLKEGANPAAWSDAVGLLPLCPGNAARVTRDGFLQDTVWVDGVEFGARRLSAVLQGEVDGTTQYFCAWATNFPIHSGGRARGVAAAGRSRSRIEESYNVQKNGGFGLEHAFRETDRGAANYHLLMQLAHSLWQLLIKGRVRREMAGCRKLPDARLAALLAAALQYCGPPAEPLPAFQLRFADG